MLPIFILLFLVCIALSGITTIPLSLPLLIVCVVIFRRPWVFFIALALGLFLDLSLLRPLGQTGLFFVLAIFIVFLYERKFETQTGMFVFASSFLSSFVYLKVFGYNHVLEQTMVNSIIAISIFRFLIRFANSSDIKN